jgi:hypothetical protein
MGRRFVEHREQILGQGERADPRANEPTEHAAGQPEGFPRPFAHAFVGHVKTAGGQAAQPVEDDAEKRIGLHSLVWNELNR